MVHNALATPRPLSAAKLLQSRHVYGVVEDHYVGHGALNPLGRISGRRYCRTQEGMDMSTALDNPYRDKFCIGTADEPGKFS
jgi:hypothetical protein